MSFEAPDLVTAVSPAGYQAEINENFEKIETALQQIQSEIGSAIPPVHPANLQWIERAISPKGVIGFEAFRPNFSVNFQTLTIPDVVLPSAHACVIGSRYHTFADGFTKDLAGFQPSTGNCRVVVGVRSNGAPQCEVIVAKAANPSEEEDAGIELAIYSFNLNNAGGTYTVQQFRREAVVLPDADSYDRTVKHVLPITSFWQGAIPTVTGNMKNGVLVPWPAIVQFAYLRLGTVPTGSQEVHLEVWREGSTAVVDDAAIFTSSSTPGSVFLLPALDPPRIVNAGSWLFPRITVAAAAGVAADLYMTVGLTPSNVQFYA